MATRFLLIFTWPCMVSGVGRLAMKSATIRQDPTEPTPTNATDNDHCGRTILTENSFTLLGTKVNGTPPELDPNTWVDDFNRYTYGNVTRGSDGREAPDDKFIRPFARCGSSIKEFNSHNRWVTLDFTSRNDKIDLQAFHMACPGTTSPTVIIVHDNKKNRRDYTVQGVGGMLRMMNFNVFIVQLRTAELTDKWTKDAMYDILGAWDFVATGIGQRQSQIAIMGFGLGAYLAKMAFGFDNRIQGLLVNGGVQDIPNLIVYQAKKDDPRFNSSNIDDCAKDELKDILKTDYGFETNSTPQVLIKKNLNKRHIGIHHFQDDHAVPVSQAHNFESEMKKLGYRVSTWYPVAEYPGGHSNMYFLHPYESATKLCEFFTKVFGQSRSSCDLENMYNKCENMAFSDYSGVPKQSRPFWQIVAIVPILASVLLL